MPTVHFRQWNVRRSHNVTTDLAVEVENFNAYVCMVQEPATSSPDDLNFQLAGVHEFGQSFSFPTPGTRQRAAILASSNVPLTPVPLGCAIY